MTVDKIDLLDKKPLPVDMQIMILERAKYNFEFNIFQLGLCGCIRFSVSEIFNFWAFGSFSIKHYIPLFTCRNAIKYANANNNYCGFWWSLNDKENRIIFLDWMLSELKNQLNNK